MKFISLFAGIGGFDLALERNGHECVYANDFDKYASIIYDKRFKNKIDQRDIKTVPTSEIPNHELLCGGFPCQSFSIAGKRMGFKDVRGTLFFDVARILREKKPRLCLLENVKGLLSHDNGATFKTIISTLVELGYDLQWQVLNSKNFGVPQNRERVFIVGHLRGTSRPEVFPIRESNNWNTKPQGSTQSKGKRIRGNIASTLAQRDYKGGNNLIQLNNPTHSNNRVYGDNGISPTINTMQGGNRQQKIFPMSWRRTEKGKEIRKQNQKNGIDYTPFSDGCREVVPNPNKKVIGTITSQAIAKDSLLGNESQIRRLTPVECERLQGFPDNWTRDGLSSIMEICVNINPVIENLLQKSDIAFSITKDGSVMEFLNYQKELKSDVSIVVDQLLLVNSVIDTINHGKDMVMLYSQKEILKNEEEIKKNLTLELMEGKSTKKLLSLYLEGNWKEEKLSIILTLIKETIASPTSMFAKIDENIIGVIIHLKKLDQNYLGKGLYSLRMANTTVISDTQRYKCLGNAVTVNVVEYIVKLLTT